MIQKNTLTIEWIEKVSQAHRKADRILVEKVIRALMLLEGLANSGMPFIFKGGTALMLLTDSPKRLSIDIDIILHQTPKNLEEILNSFVASQGFNKLELQHRHIESTIKKAHYKFYYTPIHKSNQTEEYILLDILFESNHYPKIITTSITSSFLLNDGDDAIVQVPSIEGFLGDKLTAFAPETTGIPYFKNGDGRSMEIIKQLYDIGNLFDMSTDLGTISATFHAFAKVEINYRSLPSITVTDVLKDIFQTALCITLRGRDSHCNYAELQKGLKAFGIYVYAESYHIEKAIAHSAKVAYLARLIATNQRSFEKFTGPQQVADASIGEPHKIGLQKLRKSNPEAFFYWWKATQL